MRTLKQLGVPHDENVTKFPQGTIQNETDSLNGTPVVREVYGDILTNIYKLLERTGQVPTGSEDAEDTQYQIIEALDLWANNLNDIRQTLILEAANVWAVDLKLSILPDRYVFVVLASSDYTGVTLFGATTNAVQQTFKGSESSPTYAFNPIDNFNDGDYLLIIIDTSGVLAINLTKQQDKKNSTHFTGLGSPLSYGENVDLQYENDGILMSNYPASEDIRLAIANLSGEPDTLILDAVFTDNHTLCYVHLPILDELRLFDINSSGTVSAIAIHGVARIIKDNTHKPYMYCDGLDIYFTNDFGENADDKIIAKFLYDSSVKAITFGSRNTVGATFLKTTNVVIKDSFLYTLNDSILRKFNLTSSGESISHTFVGLVGQIFKHDGKIMFSREESSQVWTI